MLGKLRKPACRALAALTAALVLLLAPLSDYTGVPDGKIEARAGVIAIPAGIAAYEVLKYALVAIATAAGVYGVASADWDSIIWEFKYSSFGKTGTNEAWADSIMGNTNYVFYDDGVLRNIQIDYAMADMAYYYFEAVGQLTPDYDLSDLPGFETDYDVIDNTAQIMERYFNDLLLNPEPITSDLERLNEIDMMLEEFLQQLQQDLADIGAHEPEVPPVSAQNELNQAICEYLNYIVHAFEANSSFYNPKNSEGLHVGVGEVLLTAWLSFLASKGLAHEAPVSSGSGEPVPYDFYETYSFVGLANCIDITSFIDPAYTGSGKYYYGFPWDLWGSTAPPSKGFVNSLNSALGWVASWGKYSGSLSHVYSADVKVYNTRAEVKDYSGVWKYFLPSGYRQQSLLYESTGSCTFGSWYQMSGSSTVKIPSSSASFSPNVTFEKDGKVYTILDFVHQDPGTAYTDPNKSVAAVPVDESGGTRLYTQDLSQSLGSLNEAVGNAAASPSTDLGSPPLKELNDAVVNLFTPPSPVDPGNPDVPVDPDNPDVPVDPDNPDVPVDPDNPSNPDTPSDPSLSDPDKWKVPLEFKNKFPFSIPWDLAACVRILQSNAVEPVWEIPFVVKTDSIDINESVVIDLTKPEFGILLAVVRGFMLLSYVMLLAMATRGLIRG